tara:strand:- start:54 stop:410 length:357 start_codon:yes stop_codon:yes gene_type:complete
MALKTLAHPVDDKRKASVQTIAVAAGVTGCTSDVVDIRGFANFTFIVTATITASSIVVSSSPDGPFYELNSLGATAAAIADLPTAAGNAYDVPELAGCHYVALDGLLSAETVQIMGKV